MLQHNLGLILRNMQKKLVGYSK